MSRFHLPTEIPPGGVMLEGLPYRLRAVLGSGGQGIAYKVANTKAGGRLECLKVLLNVRERELVERFLREKDTLAAVNHKSIVQMIDSFWLPDGRPAFTMEFVDGATVKQMLLGGQPLPVRQAVTIASEVADALVAAHAKGFIHRDIKPANIIVGHDGTVKIIDFGVAKVLQVDPNSPEEKLTINPGLIGTMAYASPEMLWRFVATPESDLYSLGLVLYEMLTGKRPFRAGSAVELAELMRTTSPPTLASAGQGGPFPDQLEWAVRSLLKANVDERTRTAREVRRQLEAIRQLLPNDAQIQVGADVRADDITVASTVVGSHPDAIAATGGPAPAALPVLRTSAPSYPSSVPTAATPTAPADEGTVPTNAFRPPAAVEPVASTPAEVEARRPSSALPWVIVIVLLLVSAGAIALLLARTPSPAASTPPAPTSVAVPTAVSVAVAPSVAPVPVTAPTPSSAPTLEPAPSTPNGKKPTTVTLPTAVPTASAKPLATATASVAPVPVVTATPPPTPPTPSTPPKPPPGGAMDDRL